MLGKRRRDSRALGHGLELMARALWRSAHETKNESDLDKVPGLQELVSYLLAKTPEVAVDTSSTEEKKAAAAVVHLQLRVDRKSAQTAFAAPSERKIPTTLASGTQPQMTSSQQHQQPTLESQPDQVWMIENLSATTYPTLLFALGVEDGGEARPAAENGGIMLIAVFCFFFILVWSFTSTKQQACMTTAAVKKARPNGAKSPRSPLRRFSSRSVWRKWHPPRTR